MIKNFGKSNYFDKPINKSDIEWHKYFDGLRNMTRLAEQAIQYETETKIRTKESIKPDLIPISGVVEVDQRKKSPKINFTDSLIKLSEEKVKPTLNINQTIQPDEMVKNEAIEVIPTNPIMINSTPSISKMSEEKVKPTLNINETIQPDELVKNDAIELVPKTPLIMNSTPSILKFVPPKQTKQRPKLQRSKGSNSAITKPPNILVYSESQVTREHVIATLRSVLDVDKYTIYSLTQKQLGTNVWIENTTLLVVCGTVHSNVGKILLDFFLKGGKMLCLCSDLLHVVLPTYRTAEVRENELVRFSYGRWEKIKMLHHIFCYQPSPVKKHFSHDSDEMVSNSPEVTTSMRATTVNNDHQSKS